MAAKNGCLRCGGATSEGFIMDRGHYNAKQQQIWVEGEPETSFLSGIRTSGKAAFNVRAFRCEDCNFLELYTADEADLDGFFN